MDNDGIFTIHSGTATAAISGTGGTVLDFRVCGEEILYPWRMVGNDKARGGCFACAPGFGPSSRWPGKHGFLRNLEASECIEQEAKMVKLAFDQPASRLYPWQMRYKTMTTIKDDELEMTLVMRNRESHNSEPAPIFPAFHPYFAYPNADKVRVFVGETEHRGFSKEARPVPLTSNLILIDTPDWQVRMKLGGAFSSSQDSELFLWSDSPNEYFCVEPVFGKKDLFDTPSGRHLEPGGMIVVSMTLTVLQDN